MGTPVPTLCPYCGVGCGLLVSAREGRVRSIAGDPDYPVNAGRTCRKPLELAAAVHASDRATVPLVRSRRDVRFREQGWEEVMPLLADRLGRIVDEHGPQAIAFYISGQLLSEDYYVVNKLAKGYLRTNNVDSNSRLCMSSAVAGYTGAFGSDGPPPSYADIDEADCFLLLGTNTAACHPILWARIQERRAQGAFVICADPRPTPTAAGSDLHLPLRPGTDLALLNAILFVIERDGLVERDFVAAATSGFEETAAVARAWPPERAAQLCGVLAEAIEQAAHRFAQAGAAMTLWSMGANQSTVGTLKNRALINLCLATGQIGRPGTGPLSLTGQPNAMGGRETGGLSQLLPGYRQIASADDRAQMERFWGLQPAAICAQPGLAAVELFDALLDGTVKAVWIVATNPLVSLPDAGRARAALERAELVVCQDAYHPTETGALAHVVLPAASWPEKEGTMTNSERRIGLVRKAIDPPGEALPDWRIFQRLAAELGFGSSFAWQSEAEVFAEFAASTAGRVCDLSGVSHERLRREGSVQWPAPAEGGSSGGRLYADGRYPTPDGRARFAPTPHLPPAEETDREYPILLTTGRVADHWHTMTRTGKSEKLRRSTPEPLLELNPEDAADAELHDGAPVRIVSRRGEATMRTALVESLPRGVAFAPFHWGALHAPPGAGTLNAVSHGASDPSSRQPELKAVAVRLEPVAGRDPGARRRRERLVVVGAGMAGLAVVEQVRSRAPAGRMAITLLGEEPVPTYNRILLSQLLARSCAPEEVELHPQGWYREQQVDLRTGCPAIGVDVEARAVIDGRGGRHPYDRLVLATGSRAVVPPIAGTRQPHVFRFRTRRDAERIAARARRSRHAVVVGGGLLGLEAAAGLVGYGVRVTVVEAAGRLMPRELDDGAAAVLARTLPSLGIDPLVSCGVATIWLDRVRLQDGRELPADVVVLAAGVRPELSLARSAGIETGRGILVDDELRTSAPSVFAVGECAEHRGVVYGLWAPLAEQARVAATAVLGDPAGFHGVVPATTLKVAGIDLFAGGAQSAGPGQDEQVWSDGRRGLYRKLVLDGDRLVGAVLVGDISLAGPLGELLRSGADCPAGLLDPAQALVEIEQDDAAVVCSCNGVTRGEIAAAIRRLGLGSLAQVASATRASTGCGSCARDVAALLAG